MIYPVYSSTKNVSFKHMFILLLYVVTDETLDFHMEEFTYLEIPPEGTKCVDYEGLSFRI